MFNIGSGELALIAVLALLVLGPKRLPELARGIGKFIREFRRQTDEVRGVVEREFYKMDQEIQDTPRVAPSPDSVAVGQELPQGASEVPAEAAAAEAPPTSEAAELPPGEHQPSQLTKGMPADSEPSAAAEPAAASQPDKA